jgi:hypothetical protein
MHLVSTQWVPSANPSTGHTEAISLADHERFRRPVAYFPQIDLAVREKDSVTRAAHRIWLPIRRSA